MNLPLRNRRGKKTLCPYKKKKPPPIHMQPSNS